MSEIDRFRDALRFLTVLPVASSPDAMAPDWLVRALKYFPVVGVLIGLLSTVTLLVAGYFWNDFLAALLAVAASMAVTGALHEDGVADTADAFGGGRSVEQRLEIMKDSRIGTYGTLALGLSVALRVAALAELPTWAAVTGLIAAHALARATPAIVMRRLSYSGDTAAMKVEYAETPLRDNEWAVLLAVCVVAILPLVFVSISAAAAGVGLAALLVVGMMAAARRLIGGYTGDVLGAVEQVCEIGFLLGVAAMF